MSAAPEPAPTPVQEPQASIVESPQRTAAKAITDYLTSIGGLAGRRKEDKSKIKQWQSALGLTADGLYGRNTAKAVILQGFVPVVPYYWPRTNTTQAKAEFTALVKQYADTDPNRKAAWDKLLSDIQRS
jgi:peptidoglycan hydrolase-like protein with peptidoglycan-binding domain